MKKQGTKTNYTIFIAFVMLTVFAISTNVRAQEIKYSYDAAGNRIKRCLSVCTGCKVANPDTSQQPTVKEVEEAMQIAMQHGISVYPNPASEMINVTVSGITSDEQALVSILDEAGRIITSFRGSTSPAQINMQDYKAGIYFVKVNVGNENLFYRVIKP